MGTLQHYDTRILDDDKRVMVLVVDQLSKMLIKLMLRQFSTKTTITLTLPQAAAFSIAFNRPLELGIYEQNIIDSIIALIDKEGL